MHKTKTKSMRIQIQTDLIITNMLNLSVHFFLTVETKPFFVNNLSLKIGDLVNVPDLVGDGGC